MENSVAALEESSPPNAPLHLVQGDHAGIALRAALRHCGLPGRVQVIAEDLSHGPLDDGRARIGYMRACCRGYGRWTHRCIDAFAPWRRLMRTVAAGSTHVVTVWASASVSDQTFLAMACHWLRGLNVAMDCVMVPAIDGRHGVGAAAPQALAGHIAHSSRLSAAARRQRAEAFVRVAGKEVLLRRYQGGELGAIVCDAYDPLLRQGLSARWQPAWRVVAAAMAGCDAHNPMSDLFFSARLRRLIDGGAVAASGDRRALSRYRVRAA